MSWGAWNLIATQQRTGRVEPLLALLVLVAAPPINFAGERDGEGLGPAGGDARHLLRELDGAGHVQQGLVALPPQASFIIAAPREADAVQRHRDVM